MDKQVHPEAPHCLFPSHRIKQALQQKFSCILPKEYEDKESHIPVPLSYLHTSPLVAVRIEILPAHPLFSPKMLCFHLGAFNKMITASPSVFFFETFKPIHLTSHPQQYGFLRLAKTLPFLFRSSDLPHFNDTHRFLFTLNYVPPNCPHLEFSVHIH